jgi:hypothetical protein
MKTSNVLKIREHALNLAIKMERASIKKLSEVINYFQAV